jgi:hypothetical protein
MDRVQKPNNHVQHTPSSESFQIYPKKGVFRKFLKISQNVGENIEGPYSYIWKMNRMI